MPPERAADLRDCAMHETLRVDARNGLRAGVACPARFVVERTFERRFAAWAVAAGRSLAPVEWSPLCAATPRDAAPGALRIDEPLDGARYLVDPARRRSDQRLRVRIAAPAGVPSVDLYVDGRGPAHVGFPFIASWPLAPGEHTFVVAAGSHAPSEPVHVVVE
jgi:hypothetical protein